MKYFPVFALTAIGCAVPAPLTVKLPDAAPSVAQEAPTRPKLTAPEPNSATETIITEQMLADAASDWIESCTQKLDWDDEHIKSDFCICAHRMFIGNIRYH